MMTLTNSNYFSPEAMEAYWSVSQFKTFAKCEAMGLAEMRGEYVREETDALLIGSYVDAYFSDELDVFAGKHADQMFTQKGELYKKYDHANDIIRRIESDALMMEYLSGGKQEILTGELFEVPWKIKVDVLTDERIVDLKIVKDFKPIYEDGFGYRPWLEYWGYDIQGAVYQQIVKQNTGKQLPFYIVAATKEKTPDIAVIEIPQPVLDTALEVVEFKIDRLDLVKTGELPATRCDACDYCKATKILRAPTVYEPEVE